MIGYACILVPVPYQSDLIRGCQCSSLLSYPCALIDSTLRGHAAVSQRS